MLRLRALNVGNISKLVSRSSRAFGGHAHGHDSHGHGHDDHHHHDEGAYQPVYHPPPPGPYDAPHAHIDRTKAFMFGEDPAHPKESEGWESITYITYVLMFGILTYSVIKKDQDPLRNWARKEALAREKAMARGEKIEYGRFLTDEKEFIQTEFSQTNIGEVPEGTRSS